MVKGVIKYTDKNNIDAFGFINDSKKVYAKPYQCTLKELMSFIETSKAHNMVVISY